jgi:hypothetical protein
MNTVNELSRPSTKTLIYQLMIEDQSIGSDRITKIN